MPSRHVWTAAAALVSLFVYRLAFGLASDFFFEDQTQIFLIGLRYFATGHWPYFGPDVVWTRSEIPGALQGLLVGLPLRLVEAPESPFVLLNLLSFGALCALAWYVTRALPQAPAWLVYIWFLTAPWTLHFSTQIINPSYVLPAAVVFFLGFFEAMTPFTLGVIRPAVAHAMMGFALVSIAQLHMSWPILIPYVGVAWLSRWREGFSSLVRNGFAWMAGAALPFALVVPTILRYGMSAGSGGTGTNLHYHLVNPSVLLTTLARFLSFGSLEIVRFIATDSPKRIEFFERNWWLIAPAAVVWIAGMVQPLWMLIEMGRSVMRWPDGAIRARWRWLRYLVAASAVLVYVSYSFVMEPAQAHAFYVLSPIALILAAYCWTRIDSPSSRRWAAGLVAANLIFHAGFAVAQYSDRSLYRRRDVIVAAIQKKNFEILGHRRAFAPDAGPYTIGDDVPRDATRDLVISRATHTSRFDGSVHWAIEVRNTNQHVAYRDLLYIATYRSPGRPDEERHEFIKDIFQPGITRVVELNDGYVEGRFDDATIRIAAAEALVPADSR